MLLSEIIFPPPNNINKAIFFWQLTNLLECYTKNYHPKKFFTKQRLLLKNFLDTKIANSFPVWYSLLSAEEFQLQKSFSNEQYRKGNFLKDCKYKSLNTKIKKFSFPILKPNRTQKNLKFCACSYTLCMLLWKRTQKYNNSEIQKLALIWAQGWALQSFAFRTLHSFAF